MDKRPTFSQFHTNTLLSVCSLPGMLVRLLVLLEHFGLYRLLDGLILFRNLKKRCGNVVLGIGHRAQNTAVTKLHTHK